MWAFREYNLLQASHNRQLIKTNVKEQFNMCLESTFCIFSFFFLLRSTGLRVCMDRSNNQGCTRAAETRAEQNLRFIVLDSILYQRRRGPSNEGGFVVECVTAVLRCRRTALINVSILIWMMWLVWRMPNNASRLDKQAPCFPLTCNWNCLDYRL